jgi:hypothetical protein
MNTVIEAPLHIIRTTTKNDVFNIMSRMHYQSQPVCIPVLRNQKVILMYRYFDNIFSFYYLSYGLSVPPIVT